MYGRRFWWGNLTEKRLLRIPKLRSDNNTEMDLKETGQTGGVD
jgi:hypothetical protein